MKNFKSGEPSFQKVEDGIYKTKCPYGAGNEDIFVTSPTFAMEPESYGEEDASPQNMHHISEDGEPLSGGLQRTVFHQNSSLHVVVDSLLRPFYLSCCWLKT